MWKESLHDGGLVKEVVLCGPNAYRRIVFEKNGEFEPCDFAMSPTSATGIFWSKGPFQSVKPVRDRFPKVDVDWPFQKLPTVSFTREKLHWFEGRSIAAAVKARVVVRGMPAEVWVKCFNEIKLLLGSLAV